VARRIVPVDAAAENGDGRPARRERPAVRLAVDPAREPAHDHEAGGREIPRKRPGDLRAVRRAAARPDDRDRGRGEHVDVRFTSHVELRRRIVEHRKLRRVAGTPAPNAAHVHAASASSVGRR